VEHAQGSSSRWFGLAFCDGLTHATCRGVGYACVAPRRPSEAQ
jgi:hypothetical protein